MYLKEVAVAEALEQLAVALAVQDQLVDSAFSLPHTQPRPASAGLASPCQVPCSSLPWRQSVAWNPYLYLGQLQHLLLEVVPASANLGVVM